MKSEWGASFKPEYEVRLAKEDTAFFNNQYMNVRPHGRLSVQQSLADREGFYQKNDDVKGLLGDW